MVRHVLLLARWAAGTPVPAGVRLSRGRPAKERTGRVPGTRRAEARGGLVVVCPVRWWRPFRAADEIADRARARFALAREA
jgi:hypothetical protein